MQILGQPSLPLDTTKKSCLTLPFPPYLPALPPSHVRSTARRNRMGRQKQTKLPKNTHHIYKTHTLPLPSAFLPSSLVELFLFDFDSSIVRSELSSSPLHFIHPRETKLCYLHLPLWLFGIKIISLPLSLSFSALFPLVIFGWIFQIYSLFVSLLKKIVPALKRATLYLALFVLTSRANCDQLIPFPFSAKNPPFHWEVSFIAQSQQRKKSPHKKTVYQSRQSRRVLLCQATSVWVLPLESQTSRIIPTTTPPLQLVVKSRRKEDLLLLYCYYIFIYYIHRHFHTLSHTHTNRKHTQFNDMMN